MASPAQTLQAATPKEESSASTNEVLDDDNEVVEDLESQVAGPSESTWHPSADSDGIKEPPSPALRKTIGASKRAPGDAGRCHRRCPCGLSRRCSACLVAFGVVLLTVAAVLWPRPVDWEVTQIVIEDEALYGLVGAITDPAFKGTAGIELDAVVEAQNRNMIGARVGEGTFVVTHGPHTLAVATTQPLVVRKQETSVIKAHSVSTITPEISSYLMDVLPPKNQLTVVASGQLPATVGAMSLTVHVDCEVDVNVLLIMRPDMRNQMVTGHRCQYRLSR